jgi:hypothetical protein
MNYLVKNYSIDKLQISKPKKHSEEYMLCKIKYPDDFFIQFPKMKLVQVSPKGVELEFLTSETKYTKECYNFLSELDTYISMYICEKSEEWFEKKIPMENIKNMYNNFIKAPKSTDHQSTINFSIKKNCTIVDRRNKELEISDLSINTEVECISQLKYILFSKDNCFTVWEMYSAKVHKKFDKVPANGFIDVEESDSENETDVEEIIKFF